jgi:hypothetical protein
MKLSSSVLNALALGVLVGGFVALTPACGPVRNPVRCNADNCPGCCDESAQCLTGLGDVTCGARGASCAPCPSGQACQAVAVVGMGDGGAQGGRCSAPTGGGSAGGGSAGGSVGGGAGGGSTGGGMGGGAGTCNAQSCSNGCCTSTGACQNPATTLRCGRGGAACMPCPGKQACDTATGACAPCAGCIDLATGKCETGSANALCGKQGDYCANCAVSNGTCMNQVCVGSMSGCNPANCATGCCDQGSGNCVQAASQTGAQCGQGTPASLCIQCPSGQCDTDAGSCLGGSGAGGGSSGAGGGFSFPGLDAGFGGTPCDPSNPCPTGQCCLTALGSGQCATINMPPPLLGLPLPVGRVCGLSGMACGTTCILPRPFGGGNMCNVTTGMCQ